MIRRPAASLLIALAVVLGSLLLSSVEASAQQLTSGRTPPVGLDGGQLADADLQEGTTLLVVWTTWSPRCRDVVPRINALADTWSSSARVAAVVFQEEPETIRDFLADKELRAPIFVDTTGTFAKQHSVTTLPMLLVIDSGKTVFRGRFPSDPNPVIEQALEPSSP